MKIYISGKITGLEPAVYSANFEKKEKELLRFGYQVFNPVKEAQKLEQRIERTFQRKPTYANTWTMQFVGFWTAMEFANLMIGKNRTVQNVNIKLQHLAEKFLLKQKL